MDHRCKYPSKPCHNTRSLKDNGDFHTLCDFHRDKANNAQRRWYTRKTTEGASREPLIPKAASRPEQPASSNQQRQRKITERVNKSTIVVAARAPRKRGRITFRDASLVRASPYITRTPTTTATPVHNSFTTIPQLYDLPLSWDPLAFVSPAFDEQIKLEYDWPVQVSVSSSNDTSLVSLFDPVQGYEDFYADNDSVLLRV